MPAFLASLVDLCRFRRGPEDMPYAPPLLIGLLVACCVLQVLFNLHQGANPRLMAAALLAGLAAIGMLFLLLRGRGKSARFVQTLTALAAVYLLFGIVTDGLALALPLKAWREKLLAHPEQLPVIAGNQILIVLVIVALGVWQLCISIHVLRRALDTPLAGAILAFLLLFIVDWIAASLLTAALGLA
ncbi:MAG: hypothetical protein EPN36_03145 [Rhodanobacteraceae bacterium]|nr:MAG: hypothetical protein EPN36_03145 [Rhodanobacteraceae bacterium]